MFNQFVKLVLKGLQIKLIEKLVSEYMEQGDPTNFTGEAKVVYWKRARSRSEQLLNRTTKAQ